MKVKIAILLAMTSVSAPLYAQTPNLAAAFGARQGARSASLSPDGKKIALIAPTTGQGSRLFIVDTEAGAVPKSILVASGRPEKLNSCGWVTNTRLICRISGLQEVAGYIFGFNSIIAIDADGQNQLVLSKRRGQNATRVDLRGGAIIDYQPEANGKILMMRSHVPEADIGSLVQKSDEGMGVDSVDTVTGVATRVENAQRDAVEFLTDGEGEVRIKGVASQTKGGNATRTTLYLYRKAGSRDWLPLSTYGHADRSGFNPYLVDKRTNLAHGLEKIEGRLALVSYTLDDAMRRSIIFRHPSVDVDGPVRMGHRDRMVGVTYATDKVETVYFDAGIKAMIAGLSKALSGKTLYILDEDTAESRFIIWAGSDTDAGQYYLFDKAAKRLSPIIPQRPQLSSLQLAQVQSISFPASDGTMIPAYLTLPLNRDAKGLPAIVLPGNDSGDRDVWGFDWLAQYFAARGFAVIQPNARGFTGFGDKWAQYRGFEHWRTSVGDVVTAGKFLIAKGIADPAKLSVFGWSFGGYLALQSAVAEPGLFKAVVAVGPVTDLATLRPTETNLRVYWSPREFIGSGPHVTEGSPARNVNRIMAPVLMFQGTLDPRGPVAQARLMDAKLKAAGKRSELVIFEGLDHQLDDEAARTQMLQRAGDFLAAAGK